MNVDFWILFIIRFVTIVLKSFKLSTFFRNNSTIDGVDSVKTLGLMVDNYLSWDFDTLMLYQKIRSACFALRSVSKELNLSVSSLLCSLWVASPLHVRLNLAYFYVIGSILIPHCQVLFKKFKILTPPFVFIYNSVIRKWYIILNISQTGVLVYTLNLYPHLYYHIRCNVINT